MKVLCENCDGRISVRPDTTAGAYPCPHCGAQVDIGFSSASPPLPSLSEIQQHMEEEESEPPPMPPEPQKVYVPAPSPAPAPHGGPSVQVILCYTLVSIVAVVVLFFGISFIVELNSRLQPPKNRDEAISRKFHPTEKYHYLLVEAVKRAMNDPDSFRHGSTSFEKKEDHVIISMYYYGRNGFGGMVRRFVKVRADRNAGDILEILEDSAG